MGIGHLSECVCFVVVSNPLFPNLSIIRVFQLKSSDLSINPHISLNLWNPWNPPWNPQIYVDFLTVKSTDFMAILRFSLNSWADLRVHSSTFVWMSVWQLGQRLPFTQSIYLSHWDAEICRSVSKAGSFWHRSVLDLIPLIFYSIHLFHHDILTFGASIHGFPCKSLDKSSDFIDFRNYGFIGFIWVP